MILRKVILKILFTYPIEQLYRFKDSIRIKVIVGWKPVIGVNRYEVKYRQDNKNTKTAIVNGSDFGRDKIIHYIKNPRVPGDPWANDSTGYSYRTNRWHFLWVPERDFMELYDVKKDPFEQKELSKDSIGVVSMIKKEIRTWNKEILNKLFIYCVYHHVT